MAYVIDNEIYQKIIDSGLDVDLDKIQKIDSEAVATALSASKSKSKSNKFPPPDYDICTTEYVYMFLGIIFSFISLHYFLFDGIWYSSYAPGIHEISGSVKCSNDGSDFLVSRGSSQPANTSTDMFLYQYSYFSHDNLVQKTTVTPSSEFLKKFNFTVTVTANIFDYFKHYYLVFDQVCEAHDRYRIGAIQYPGHEYVF